MSDAVNVQINPPHTNMEQTNSSSDLQEVTRKMDELCIKSFDSKEDVKRLIDHLDKVLNDTEVLENPKNKLLVSYLQKMKSNAVKSFNHKNVSENVAVAEYIFVPEGRTAHSRQRFNSICVGDVKELTIIDERETELTKTHGDIARSNICVDCNVEIVVSPEDDGFGSALNKHFQSEIHNPRGLDSISTMEDFVIPNMSRRKSAMERGETANVPTIIPMSNLDREFTTRLETALRNAVGGNSVVPGVIETALKLYQEIYGKLLIQINQLDFQTLAASVAPVIVSIKDNVYQNFNNTDANKSIEVDDSNQTPEKNQMKNSLKKYRYYGPIEAAILKLLVSHKLVSLTDDRAGKAAFFCVACEYYTLRFTYDSVLHHIFSDTHVHNLSEILENDHQVTCEFSDRTVEQLNEVNLNFLSSSHKVKRDINNPNSFYCGLCKDNSIDNLDACVDHIVDESHMAKLSDKIYRKMKAAHPDSSVPEEWGQKSLEWSKSLTNGKKLSEDDKIVIENFIKPCGKLANYCTCCDSTLKGPRQVLFNHIRQKKHLKNAAPKKIRLLYENHCRGLDYYSSFGNYFICTICEGGYPVSSISSLNDHVTSDLHAQSIARLLRLASGVAVSNDFSLLDRHRMVPCTLADGSTIVRCDLCNMYIGTFADIATHVLSETRHQTYVAEREATMVKRDILALYLNGKHIVGPENGAYKCIDCDTVLGSLRALLAHTVYAEHLETKPDSQAVFSFYLELKNNAHQFGRHGLSSTAEGVRCSSCNVLLESETVGHHVASAEHKVRAIAAKTDVPEEEET